MKQLVLVLTPIVLFCSVSVAQTKWEKNIDIPFGSEDAQLHLRTDQLQRTKLALGSFPRPRDILISEDSLFYIPDALNWRILVYSYDGRLINTISVPRKAPSSVPLHAKSKVLGHWMYLAEDSHKNLYVHVTSMERRLIALYKFDKDRRRIVEFSFSGREPGGGDLVGKIYFGGSDYLYIPSQPVEIIRANWDNMVYKYDPSGRFVAMVDYFIEDKLGFVYKSRMTKVNSRYDWELFKFESPSLPTANSKQLTKVQTVSIPTGVTETEHNELTYWFCGFDRESRVYITNGNVIKILTASLSLLREMEFPKADLEQEMGFVSQSQNIRVSPDGNIYVFGLKTPNGKEKISYRRSEVSFVVLHLK